MPQPEYLARDAQYLLKGGYSWFAAKCGRRTKSLLIRSQAACAWLHSKIVSRKHVTVRQSETLALFEAGSISRYIGSDSHIGSCSCPRGTVERPAILRTTFPIWLHFFKCSRPTGVTQVLTRESAKTAEMADCGD